MAVRRFTAWLADPDIDEIDADPFVGVRPPKIDTKVVQGLSEDDLRLMLKACAGRDLNARRDEAMLRLLVETGMRAGELMALKTYDINLGEGQLVIRRGKGGKGRAVAFSATTAAALDRYLRVRRRHRYADSGELWLTKTGASDGMTYHGMRMALLGRAEAAGVTGFHVHKLRHTFASRWLSAGGSEGGLMVAAGGRRGAWWTAIAAPPRVSGPWRRAAGCTWGTCDGPRHIPIARRDNNPHRLAGGVVAIRRLGPVVPWRDDHGVADQPGRAPNDLPKSWIEPVSAQVRNVCPGPPQQG